MSTIAVFLALGGGSLAAANGGNGGGTDSNNGDTAANGSLSVTTRDGDSVSPDTKTDIAVATASCDNSETLIGGGVRTPGNGQPLVMSSGPDGDKWTATVYDNSGGDNVKVIAYAICAATK